jgi:hypothetical protein
MLLSERTFETFDFLLDEPSPNVANAPAVSKDNKPNVAIRLLANEENINRFVVIG